MRLIRLRIKNIASLKGEHLVDFEEIQNQSSLFAITGETGSGKSSILSSVALALYGRNYKGLNQPDLVTLGEKEAEVQLLFQVGGKNFLADWKAKVRGRSGEPLKVPLIERKVYPIAGDDFNSNRSEPIESIERLLNLDFDQFCKCIILNQGEFARFLTSPFKDRKEILEKLYPGEMLDNLSRELKTQLDTLNREKSDLDIKLGELQEENVSGDDLILARDRLKNELELHESWLGKLGSLEVHFVSLTTYHGKWHENKKRADTIAEQIAAAQTAYNECLKESEGALESYAKAKARQDKELPGLQELLKAEVELKNTLENATVSDKRLKELDLKLGHSAQILADNEQKLTNWKASHEQLARSFRYNVEELQAHRHTLEKIIDLYTEVATSNREQKALEERLLELETQGKELAQQLLVLSDKCKALPTNYKERLASLEERKTSLVKSIEQRQKAEITCQQLKKQIDQHDLTLRELENKIKNTTATLVTFEQQLLALDTTLKLQELSTAVEVCLTHAESAQANSCPVCENVIPPVRWKALLSNLKKADIEQLKGRSLELSRLVMQLQTENKHAADQIQLIQTERNKKDTEIKLLQKEMEVVLPSLKELDDQISDLKQKAWEFEKFKAEEVNKQTELSRTRENYVKIRAQLQELQQKISQKDKEFLELTASTQGLITSPLDLARLEALKEDLRLLSQYIQNESQGEKLKQERSFQIKVKSDLQESREDAQKEVDKFSAQITTLKTKLELALKGKSAQELIETLNREVRETSEKKEKAEKGLRQQEDNIKDCRGKQYGVEEQLKEYDLLFIQERHNIREAASRALPEIKESLTALLQRLKNLALDFEAPAELFIPIKEILTAEKESLKDQCNHLREARALALQRLQDWEKRQDKIKILEITRAEIIARLQRQQRLQEVLGQDNLRTFVLSLVEENLIYQTNDELQKLCQGRYEIIHQSRGKRETPEFYILDKFREGGSRKVSTLSGGETFMVSLAMALALAEMTRGQAEIDTLFIDEGFGTLDQDSLEDVLDVLNQIQTRGLLVGIISHIKALTSAIPVNLVLTKKQDGTSSITVQAN